MELFDPAGSVVRLGPQLGPKGGEGCVYEVSSDQGLVAKIFHKPAELDKRAKLIHMIGLTTSGLTSFAAWPKSLLLDRHHKLLGFLMPKAIGVEIHEVFSRTQRSTAFPGKEWNFSVRVARNCSAAFDEIHNAGGAIGDVNEGNLLVGQNGMVSLIDYDSYQMTANGRTWTCDVGVPIWTAPELQGRDFRGLHRTVNTDLFSLALLIFKILFMGRHPFAGVPLTTAETTLERCIAEFRFAFTCNSQLLHIKPPPGVFPFEALPQAFRKMFDRAFLHGSEQPDARPSAKEWVTYLPIAQELQNRMNEANKLLKSALSNLQGTENDYQSAFLKTKEELKSKHYEIQRLENCSKDEIRILEASKRQLLLNAFLDSFLLKSANISGIGPKRLCRLLSSGIETALDVGRSYTVPGIGESYYAKLLQWRDRCEQRFKFDPAQAVPVAEVERIKLKFAQPQFRVGNGIENRIRAVA